MTLGDNAHEFYKRFIKKRDCQHPRAYVSARGHEERDVHDDDYKPDVIGYVVVEFEVWECPDCGATWTYDVD